MNGHGTALQRVCVAGAVAGVLWGMGAAGPPLARGGPLRPPSSPLGRSPQASLGTYPQASFGTFPQVSSAREAIVNGESASIAEFPFQVALYDPRLGAPARGFFCGGVILDATRVATAAHCLIGEGGRHSATSEIEVLAGSSNLDSLEPGSVTDTVTSATVDPAYEPASSDYDVGVLSLARPLWSGATPALNGRNTIAPLAPDTPLAEARSAAALAGLTTAPVEAIVSGWGEENAEPGSAAGYPPRLHKARVPLVSMAFCAEAYATIEQTITPRMLCAGGLLPEGLGRTDSCYGDSGGPLVASETGSPPPAGDVLLGLVDFGNGCAQPGYPGVYLRAADTAVANFLQADPARASSGGVRRGLCARHLHRGHRHGGRRGHRSHGRGRNGRRCKL
jgi:trypsin